MKKILQGYSIVGLDNPKTHHNVGSAMRAVKIFSAEALFFTGRRYKSSSTDTMRANRYKPLIHVQNLRDIRAYNCIPVAVDLIEGATSIVDYKHPKRAFYIFGAEDATLGKKILSWCRDTIYIPTNGCMNLAAAVNVVLYDRSMKTLRK